MEANHEHQSSDAEIRARPIRNREMEIERRDRGGRDIGQAGWLSGWQAVSPDRSDSRRTRKRLYEQLLGKLWSLCSRVRRQRICRLSTELSRLDELRRKIQDGNRRRLFQAGLRRYHHWCRLPDSAWDRRSGQIGNDGMECWRPLVQLDSDAYRSIQSHLVGSRSRQLGFYVCSDRSTAASRVLFQGKAV